MKKIVCLVLTLVLMLSTCTALAADTIPNLSDFSSGKRFTLLQHYANDLCPQVLHYESSNPKDGDMIPDYVEYLVSHYGGTVVHTKEERSTYTRYRWWYINLPSVSSSKVKYDESDEVSAHVILSDLQFQDNVQVYLCVTEGIGVKGISSAAQEDSNRKTSGGGSSNHTPRPTVTKRPRSKCHAVGCNGGKVMCRKCNGKGYKTKTVSVPNYSGKGKTTKEVKEYCSCSFGYNTCSVCGGDGWVND